MPTKALSHRLNRDSMARDSQPHRHASFMAIVQSDLNVVIRKTTWGVPYIDPDWGVRRATGEFYLVTVQRMATTRGPDDDLHVDGVCRNKVPREDRSITGEVNPLTYGGNLVIGYRPTRQELVQCERVGMSVNEDSHGLVRCLGQNVMFE